MMRGMGMAQPEILNALTNRKLGTTLPAKTDERREQVDDGQDVVESRGRTPAEVVGDRSERTTDEQVQTVETPPAKRYKIGDREITEEEFNNLETTAKQLPTLQKKYLETLEKQTTTPTATTAKPPAPAAPPVITQAQIRQAFMPMLQKVVELGYIEADFAEAYPDVGVGLMFFRSTIEEMDRKLGLVVDWIKAEIDKREAVSVESLIDKSIDAVLALNEPTSEKLKKSEIRAEFVAWLKNDVDPKIDKITPENMGKFWFAYNSDELRAAMTQQIKKAEKPPVTNAKAKGDGSASRTGSPEIPEAPGLMDRLFASKLGNGAAP